MPQDNYIKLGKLLKSHGINGEVVIQIDNPNQKKISDKDHPIFIEINGQPVPFFIEYILSQNAETLILKFDDINSQEEARRLQNSNILLSAKSFAIPNGKIIIPDLNDFIVFDHSKGEIGRITNIIPIPENPVLEIQKEGPVIMLPYSEGIIEKIDTDNKKLYVNIPEGLLDIYTKD